jgi:hypothetical protein
LGDAPLVLSQFWGWTKYPARSEISGLIWNIRPHFWVTCITSSSGPYPFFEGGRIIRSISEIFGPNIRPWFCTKYNVKLS